MKNSKKCRFLFHTIDKVSNKSKISPLMVDGKPTNKVYCHDVGSKTAGETLKLQTNTLYDG